MVVGKYCFLILLIAGLAASEFYIVNAPSTMSFAPSNEKPVLRQELPGIINFLLGLPSQYLHRVETWPGLESFDVFNPPKVNVLISLYVPSGSSFVPEEFKIKYATTGEESAISPVNELNTALSSRGVNPKSYELKNMFSDLSGGVDMQKIKKRLAQDDSVLASLPAEAQDLSSDDETRRMLGEIQMVNDVASKMDVHKTVQSVHILLTSLQGIAHKYGSTSPQVMTGINLFKHIVQQLNAVLEKKFKDQVIFEVDVISSMPPAADYLVRKKRATPKLSSDQSINVTTLNLATPSDTNYAVVFSIVLWLMIAFFLAVLVVAYSMWYMDPGKDNIVYKVTSQRMKSD